PLLVEGNISKGRIALSHKELLGSWEENAGRFEIGQTVAGIVRSIENYGIFVELAPNLAGLAEYKAGVEVGEVASVYIKNIIPQKMKVKLVIIDSYSSDKSFIKNEYFITEGNVADWKY
ncbi:MAG: 30S ribosomal protein S1, partial [Clostridia bacterium]|nr:30S ribosomal protein S1 [Clostridia bacterium]